MRRSATGWKHLEANGLIERRCYQTNPERFEYHLTQKGWQIAPVMPVLAQIGDRLDVSGASAPPMTFVNRKTGAEVRLEFHRSKEHGEQVSPGGSRNQGRPSVRTTWFVGDYPTGSAATVRSTIRLNNVRTEESLKKKLEAATVFVVRTDGIALCLRQNALRARIRLCRTFHSSRLRTPHCTAAPVPL